VLVFREERLRRLKEGGGSDSNNTPVTSPDKSSLKELERSSEGASKEKSNREDDAESATKELSLSRKDVKALSNSLRGLNTDDGELGTVITLWVNPSSFCAFLQMCLPATVQVAKIAK
jgi:hypothetical protein